MSDDTCPHCNHNWAYHLRGKCLECGCLWPHPTVAPPPPPTDRDLLVERVADAIWSALEEQDIYADREMGMVDASGSGLDMTEVAAAVLASLEADGWVRP